MIIKDTAAVFVLKIFFTFPINWLKTTMFGFIMSQVLVFEHGLFVFGFNISQVFLFVQRIFMLSILKI